MYMKCVPKWHLCQSDSKQVLNDQLMIFFPCFYWKYKLCDVRSWMGEREELLVTTTRKLKSGNAARLQSIL